jgi:putative membrane-bound dehydrogenase-like protein
MAYAVPMLYKEQLAALAFFTLSSAGQAADYKFGTQTITVPDGYRVELAAAPPLVDRPIMGDFDEHGRLFVAEASGTNADVQTQLKERPHRILCLEDTDGDGTFDKRTEFADKMMFPAGVLCYRGSVYVSAPPSIWKLTDTTGDGIADRRDEWLDAKTLTGCANDLHGPYLGRDGWIYWCKGAFAEQTYPRSKGDPFVTRAAHIFRQRPEGSEIEPVMTGGMDNPVEVAFSPSGERFFTSTFVQHPGGGLRDGIMHAIYGGVYGKPHDVIDGHPRTSAELMPVMTQLGNAAACALEWIDSDALGMQGDLLATLFNMRKVTRHQLTPDHSTFHTQDSDFLVSDSIDFHPTDVIEDADGSLLVIDTGGWYKLCCPTSQLHKPDVLGAIYRVRKVADDRIASAAKMDPRGKEIDWTSSENLMPLLGDERVAVNERAIDQLAQTGTADVIEALANVLTDESGNESKRLSAVWALCRIDSPGARAVTRTILQSSAFPVRAAALHAAAVWRDKEASAGIRENLACPDAAVRRAAAEAAGRAGDPACVPEILAAIATAGCDQVLLHSLTYALIELAAAAEIRNGLVQDTESNLVRIAALTALDQMRPAGIDQQDVVPLMFNTDAELRDSAWGILATHPEWLEEDSGGSHSPAMNAIISNASSEITQEKLIQVIDRLPRMQEIIGQWAASQSATSTSTDDKKRALAMRVISDARVAPVPESWLPVHLMQLTAGTPAQRKAAVIALTSAPLPEKPDATLAPIRDNLRAFALTPSESFELRLRAGEASLAKREGEPLSDPIAELALSGLSSDQPAARRTAADIFTTASAALTATQRTALVDALPGIAPLELGKILPLLSGDSQVALTAMQKLGDHPALSTVPDAALRELLEMVPEESSTAFISKTGIFADDSTRAAQLEATLEALPFSQSPEENASAVVRGQHVFNSSKAMCTLCHPIGYGGGRLGPDLTSIGTIRSRRDLLESVMFPSASLVRSYETLLVTQADGTETLGIPRRDNADGILLATGPDTEISIPRDRIQTAAPSKTSLMLPGIHLILTPQELSDLITFLENTRWR